MGTVFLITHPGCIVTVYSGTASLQGPASCHPRFLSHCWTLSDCRVGFAAMRPSPKRASTTGALPSFLTLTSTSNPYDVGSTFLIVRTIHGLRGDSVVGWAGLLGDC